MPKRFNSKKRQRLLDAVIRRDGDICLLCHKTDFKDKERNLDHMDGNKWNNRLVNLHLLCRGCNTAENNRAETSGRKLTAETLSELYAALPQNTEAASLPSHTHSHPYKSPRGRDNRDVLDRGGQSGAAGVSTYLMEAHYRDWLAHLARNQKQVTEQEALNSGAEYLHRRIGRGSPVTVRRYFDKITSPEGWLEEFKDARGRSLWRFRKGENLEALFEELARDVTDHGGTLGSFPTP